MEDGRCGVHGKQPFSCDFELIRSLKFSDPEKSHRLTQKLFGRGWQLLRIDGQRGARCEMLSISEQSVADVVRKLGRLKQWCEHFGLKHRVDVILDWAGNSKKRQVNLMLKTQPWKFHNLV